VIDSIGEIAGRVWLYLSQNGKVSASKLIREVGTPRDSTQRAIGWLAREDKINIEKAGRTEKIFLK